MTEQTDLPIEKQQPITSDIANLPKESNIAREEFLQRIKAGIAQDEEFDKQVKTIEKEIGLLDWTYINKITEEEPFNVSQFANFFLCRPEYNIVTDKNSQVIYLYTDKTGIYHKKGEQHLQYLIDKVLGPHSNSHRINESINLLKIRTFASITYSQKIAVQNGLLISNLGSWNLSHLASSTPTNLTSRINKVQKANPG